MGKPRGPKTRKFGPYVRLEIIDMVNKFSSGRPSMYGNAAFVALMALPPSAVTAIITEASRDDVSRVVERARSIIRDAVIETIAVDHFKGLPKQEQARIIAGHKRKRQ